MSPLHPSRTQDAISVTIPGTDEPRSVADLQLSADLDDGGAEELATWFGGRASADRRRVLLVSHLDEQTEMAAQIGRALARRGLGVLTVDLTDDSGRPGLTDVAAGRRLSSVVTWDDELNVAHLGGGHPREEHPESLAKVAHQLPRDVDVLLVVEDRGQPLPFDELFDALDLVILLHEDPVRPHDPVVEAQRDRVTPLPLAIVSVPTSPAPRDVVHDVWQADELAPPPSSDVDVDPAEIWGP